MRFQTGASQGAVSLMARDDHYALVFELALDQPTDLEVVLPDGSFRIDAFARETANPASAVSWSDNRFAASIQGAQRFVLRLSGLPGQSGAEADIELRLLRDGAVVHAGVISTRNDP